MSITDVQVFLQANECMNVNLRYSFVVLQTKLELPKSVKKYFLREKVDAAQYVEVVVVDAYVQMKLEQAIDVNHLFLQAKVKKGAQYGYVLVAETVVKDARSLM